MVNRFKHKRARFITNFLGNRYIDHDKETVAINPSKYP